VTLLDGATKVAITPVYAGKNIIASTDLPSIVAMVRNAHGTGGACVDYVRNIAAALRRLSIHDPQVEELGSKLGD
jgi:cation transport regulator ChaC